MALNSNKRDILAKTGAKVKPISSVRSEGGENQNLPVNREHQRALNRALVEDSDRKNTAREGTLNSPFTGGAPEGDAGPSPKGWKKDKDGGSSLVSSQEEPQNMPSKADALRNSGFKGLAELEDMQNKPLGSTSSLSGPGSRRTITSPARSLERQARRYQKFGRAGEHAAAQLLGQAAEIRTKTPSLRTEAGIKAGQAADAVADNLAGSAINRAGKTSGNEMPPPEEQRTSRRKTLGYHKDRKFY